MNEQKQNSFFRAVCALAIPAALQSMLQSSFSIVDQIMIGQLGEIPISAVGFGGKFFSIFSVVIAAIGTVAGIMIAQYIGQKNSAQLRKSFFTNLLFALSVGAIALLLGLAWPGSIIGLYTKDEAVRQVGADYLWILSLSALPMAGATMLATYFRCVEKAHYPMLATIVSAALNTVLNFLLIFGFGNIPPMGATGAAIATTVSQFANCLIMLVLFLRYKPFSVIQEESTATAFPWTQYVAMLLPLLICEVAWSIGENVYAGIYGHISTDASAAMNLMNPIQGLVIGMLCGLSQAAGVIVGKRLGNREYDGAYTASKKLMQYGIIGSLALSAVVVLISPFYVKIFQVDPDIQAMTTQLLLAYAAVSPFKVLNMVLGGGILRSGGKTNYVMVIDLLGTWVIGVPVGLLTAFVFRLPIAWVYFFLSLEECIRFLISLIVFRRKKWMHSL